MCKDSFLAGTLYGMLVAMMAWLLFEHYDRLPLHPSLKGLLQPPNLQLLMLGVCMILFRLMMINWQKIQTGRGFLLVIILATLVLFFRFR
jgi:hypothetical protein